MPDTTYAPETFTEFAIELAPDAPPVVLDGQEIPADLPERFLTLLKHNSRIRALWQRDPQIQFPSGKKTDSEYAAGLMVACGRNGFTDPECAAILRQFYARPGMKPLHNDKEAKTLRFAVKGREDALREEQEAPAEAVEEPVAEKVEHAGETRTTAAFVPAEVLWDEPDEPVEYDVEDLLLRGSQGWWSSAPRYGKTYLSMHLGSRLAAGRALLDHYKIPTPRRVLMVQEEDPRRRVKQRLKLLIPSDERAMWQGRFLLLIEAGLRLDEGPWQEWLTQQVREHDAEVLILDVWRWLHSADTNSEKELKPILRFLTRLRRDFGLTIIILTHDSKPKQGPEGSKEARRITGNWSQWAWAQFGWFLKKRGNVVEVETEGKDLEAVTFAFRFEGGKDGTPLRFVWQPPKLTEGEERRKRLAAYLMEHPGEWVTLGTLTNVASVSEDTARKDLEALVSEPGFETWKMPVGRTKKRVYRYVNTPE